MVRSYLLVLKIQSGCEVVQSVERPFLEVDVMGSNYVLVCGDG